jgi:TetR/AcrR family transcriptional regulator, regulator of autoinduction and epiphytic fitness
MRTFCSAVKLLCKLCAWKILAGGMREFLAHGYAATSMDRVAIAAKVSKATVYSHFQDKEGLFKALIQQLVEKKFQSIFGTPDEQSLQLPPEQVLRALAHRALDMANEPQFLNFIGAIVHYIIIQEMMHGHDILPMERDRIIDGLILLIVGQEKR